MPLVYQQNINESTQLGVWYIQESEAYLLESIPLLQQIHHPHKRLQHLAGRFILKQMQPDFPLEKILISATNKPFLLSEQYHFSISHCGDYAAAIISTQTRTGIDIEIPKEKILSIRKKFMNADEYLITDLLTELQLATMIWSAKEAVFKWYGTGSVDFKKHMQIVSVEKSAAQYLFTILFSKEEHSFLKVWLQMQNGICIAWLAQ